MLSIIKSDYYNVTFTVILFHVSEKNLRRRLSDGSISVEDEFTIQFINLDFCKSTKKTTFKVKPKIKVFMLINAISIKYTLVVIIIWRLKSDYNMSYRQSSIFTLSMPAVFATSKEKNGECKCCVV